VPAEVWLDAAGLARRISVNSEPAAAADTQAWSIVELWDFGVAADITPPDREIRLPLAGRCALNTVHGRYSGFIR
jgi:hypothetical protein